MARKRFAFPLDERDYGTLGAQFATAAGTIDLGEVPNWPTVASPDVVAITLPELGETITATYVSGASTATVVDRAVHGTEQTHASGSRWTHGPVPSDFPDEPDTASISGTYTLPDLEAPEVAASVTTTMTADTTITLPTASVAGTSLLWYLAGDFVPTLSGTYRGTAPTHDGSAGPTVMLLHTQDGTNLDLFVVAESLA